MHNLTKRWRWARPARWFALVTAAVFMVVASMSASQAQQKERPPVRIDRVSSQIQSTPRYDVSRTAAVGRGRSREWYIAKVEYETKPEWIDELTVTFYLWVRDGAAKGGRDRGGRQEGIVLRGQTTYVDIKRGSHKAVMAIQPSTLERYGPVQRLAAEISVGGRAIDTKSEPATRSPWWSQSPNKDGLVINRLSSPWAMLYFDEFEAIKASTGRR